jgi:hypothetical protein
MEHYSHDFHSADSMGNLEYTYDDRNNETDPDLDW